MKVTIKKSKAHGILMPPPSKSYAHRLLIVSALAKNESVVENIELSNDIIATINCLKTLGKSIEYSNHKVTIKTNCDINDLPDVLEFDCNESGSTLRFFIPIALTTGKKVVFKGSKRLIQRGILPYEEIFKEQGISVLKEEESLTFLGKLKSGIFNVSGNISSQFITGLLFSLPLLDGDSKIVLTTNLESSNYVDITLDTIKKAGVHIETALNGYIVKGNQQYISNNYYVESDYSNAAFLDAFNYLGGSVELIGLNPDSYQGDKVYIKHLKTLANSFAKIDISNCIDLGPILFCFSALMHGGHFLKTSRLKIKESDRVGAVSKELEKFGVKLIDLEDEVIIDNSNIHKPSEVLYGQKDHRIIMALSVMLSVYGGTIEKCEDVAKSYPSFFDDLKKLGIEVEVDA